MFNLIKDFPAQVLQAVEIGEQAVLKYKFEHAVTNVVICGLGGSGIGGDVLSELLRPQLGVPVIVNKGYNLPAFVGKSTLLILSSYSGNTEETLACARAAIKKGVRAACITSGGKLTEIALKHNFDLIQIPSGFPPRTCLGYSLTQLFFVLKHHGLISDEFKANLIRSASFLQLEQQRMQEEAEFLAARILNKPIIVYAEDKYQSVALRLKQQINENAKAHCWINVLPELNHNELVGWSKANENMAVVVLRTDDEYQRNTLRITFTEGVLNKLSQAYFEIKAKGHDAYEKRFYLIHFGDWLSYHLALMQGQDPFDIEVLNKLKSHLSAISE
jgi:glucose/mannose-6-phosphate isomerase